MKSKTRTEINDKLQGSEATNLTCGRLLSDQHTLSILLSLLAKKINIREHLLKLQTTLHGVCVVLTSLKMQNSPHNLHMTYRTVVAVAMPGRLTGTFVSTNMKLLHTSSDPVTDRHTIRQIISN